MDSLLQFDVNHAYLVVFAAVLLDVIALPLVAMPVLLLAGGLAATGKVSLLLIIAFATLASAAGDTLWYSIGRYGSPQLMGFLGRTGGKETGVLLTQHPIYSKLRHGLSDRVQIRSRSRLSRLPSRRHREHVDVTFLGNERGQPSFLGSQCLLLGLFRNSVCRDPTASILIFRSKRRRSKACFRVALCVR